ncbi:hypothetical protein GOP47_0029791 [Adiantum capillus-veneris]|nr:hypothetical protein GOP47_0029791 [Adiantum capillus-veneris]
MADPYEFLVRESTVSSSQEDVLQRIPGWEEKGAPALSPSQADQPLSRLCGTSGSSSSDEEDAGEEREPAFGLQRPLELASPDTQACQEDSYNPAFESDRERSLSPHADCSLFTGLWGSGLITQSQDVVGGITQIGTQLHGIVRKCNMASALHDNVSVKDHNNVFAEIFNHAFLSSKEHRTSCLQRVSEDNYQTNFLELAAFGDTNEHLKQIVAPPILRKRVDHQKNNHTVGMLDPSEKSANLVERMTFTSNQAPCKQSHGVVSNGHPVQSSLLVNKGEESCAKDATLRPRCSANSVDDAENGNKRKSKEGDPVQKLKCSKDDSHMQEKIKQSTGANELKCKEGKGSQMKADLEGNSASGTSATKCVLPVFITKGKSILENKASIGVNKSLKSTDANCMLPPESVMDVVQLVSGILPTPSPNDPDLLSVFMNTGVSLPLPLRDCGGHLICNKSSLS